MFRRSTWAVALVLVFSATAARALGLGGMRTQSALNQPFYAEIDLLDVAADELDAVKVRLASRAEFEEAGTERPHFLTRLSFTPMIGPSGEPMVQVTSREPVREPYLDFLVEVIWPQGRMVKEYTVLLDPPATDARATPRIARPQVSAPVRRPPPQPEPAPMRRPPPQSEPLPAPPAPSPAGSAPAPEPAPRPQVAASPAAPQMPAQAAGTDFPLRYGPVRSGAGLWRIARNLAPPDATVAQTAMALYRNNQDAFVGGDINKLKIGADLAIPTARELFALDADRAEAEFRDALAGRSVTNKPLTDVDAALRIAAAPPAPAPAPDQEVGEASPDAPANVPGSASGNVGQLEGELLDLRANSEANRQEAQELRERVRELEDQLSDIRMLLELRNEQLRRLQGAGAGGRVAGADRAGQGMASDVPPVEAGAANGVAMDVPPETDVADAVATDVPPAGDFADATADDGPPAGGRLAGIEEARAADAVPPLLADEVLNPEPSAAGDGRAVLGPPKVASAEAESPAAVSVKSTEDSPVGSGPLAVLGGMTDVVPAWALAAGGSAVLGLVGLLFWQRRRRQILEEWEASPTAQEPLSVELPDDFDPAPAPAAAAAAAATAEDPAVDSPVADRPKADPVPVSTFGTPDAAIDTHTGLPPSVSGHVRGGHPETQETDVISEADIYILYGRYREAENLLLEELERSPGRVDVRYKLAEAHIGSNNREALATLVAGMEEAGESQADPAKWQTINQALAEMGSAQQAPAVVHDDEPLPSSRPVASTSSDDDIDRALGKAVARVEQSGSGEVSTGAGDTSPGMSAREVSPSSAEALRSQIDELELDLQNLDLLGPTADSQQPPSVPDGGGEQSRTADLTEEPSDLDLDLEGLRALANLDQSAPGDSAHPDSTPAQPERAPTGTASTSVRLSDPVLEAAEAGAAERPASDVQAASVDREDSASSSDLLSSQWRMDSGLWDEAATKMDLARAYIEMEDPEAARGILEEVVQEGNDEQRDEAKRLLGQIA